MAFDSTKPAITDNYSTGYTQAIRDNLGALLAFCDGVSFVGTPPTGAKRYNATSDLFEQYSGGWSEMPLAYLKLSGGTISGSLNVTGTLSRNGSTVWDTGNLDPATKANLSGATFTGAIATNGSNNITAGGRLFGNGGVGNGLRVITVQNGGSPPAGAQGDVCFIW
jgi:hypothetical protein